MVSNIKRLRLPHYNTMILSMLFSTHKKAIKFITDNELVINNIWKNTLLLLLMYTKFPHLLQTTRSNHLCISFSLGGLSNLLQTNASYVESSFILIAGKFGIGRIMRGVSLSIPTLSLSIP